MPTPYATLAYTKALLKSDLTTGVSGIEAKLLRLIRTASGRLDIEFASRRPLFAPYYATRKLRVRSEFVNSLDNTLTLPWPVLELDSVTNGGVVVTDVEAWPDATTPPFHQLRLTATCCASWYDYCNDTNTAPLQTAVTGWFGVHRDYANAWETVDALAAAIVSTTAPTFTVADVDGADVYGDTPRISAGNLVRVDDEIMEVIATTIATNTVTVRRGQLGTTAATHLIGATVSTFAVEDAVRYAVARQAGLMLSRLGAYTTTELQGMGEIRYPADQLTEVRAVVNDFNYML